MRKPYPEETVSAAVNDYLNGENCYAVADRYGMSASSLCRMVKRRGKTMRSVGDSKRIYSIDKHFFRQIDSHDKAQILGFIYADGCLQIKTATSGYLNITLSPDDTDYLEWVRRVTQSNRPLSFTDYVHGGKRKRGAWFTTSQPEIVRDLQNLGVTPRKSLTLQFPSNAQVPPEFLGSFVRGYFEGDGCIHVRGNRGGPTLLAKITLIGSVFFVDALRDWFNRHSIKSNITIHATTDGQSAYSTIVIDTVASVMRFHDLIYADGTYRMERKHAKFLRYRAQYREMVSESGEKSYELLQRKTFSAETVKRIGDASRARGPNYGRSICLKDSSGRIWLADSNRSFCREMHLHHGHTRDVSTGKAITHKGWTKPSDTEIAAARAAGTLIEKIYRPSPICAETSPVLV